MKRLLLTAHLVETWGLGYTYFHLYFTYSYRNRNYLFTNNLCTVISDFWLSILNMWWCDSLDLSYDGQRRSGRQLMTKQLLCDHITFLAPVSHSKVWAETTGAFMMQTTEHGDNIHPDHCLTTGQGQAVFSEYRYTVKDCEHIEIIICARCREFAVLLCKYWGQVQTSSWGLWGSDEDIN